ncbi:ThuA domain-containing protein [Oleiharenicola lentus]|uniref:ThuA domain-containing protein n=1 Tax=Oleiharenicola lentus TaxID=2508720 RepID=UPI003F67D96C
MKLYPKLLVAGLVAFGMAVSAFAATPLRVLYFTKSSGFEHSVIKRVDGQPSFSEKILTKLGAEKNIEFTFSKDGSLFSKEYFTKFDVVLFYTSGDLLSVGTDGNPAITPEGKQALLDAVAGGKGFAGLHAASDTFHTYETGGGNPPVEKRGNRYIAHGDAADAYIKMLGGEFIRHGAQQVAKARVIDHKFPGFAGLAETWECQEEWYTTKEFASNLHVLLVLETAGMKGEDYQRPSFPIAWARTHGKGRVWFNAMGHRDDVWESPQFQATLIGGLEWAGKRVDADVTPNLPQVTPEAAKIQPLPAPPVPKK